MLNVLFIVWILINSLSNIQAINCPILRSFTNNTGILVFDKTSREQSRQLTSHCQWLVVSSLHQVIEYIV